MRKLLLVMGSVALLYACGPSAEQQAAEKATQDSIAAVKEQAKMDSIATIEAVKEQAKQDSITAAVEQAKQDSIAAAETPKGKK